MKTHLRAFGLILLLLVVSGLVSGQGLVEFYSDESYIDSKAAAAVEDKDGNIIYVGYFGDGEYVNNNGLIAKVSPQGELLARREFMIEEGVTQNYFISQIFDNESGNYTVVGCVDENNSSSSISLIKVDNDLNLLSEKRIKIDGYEEYFIWGFKVVKRQTNDSYLIVADVSKDEVFATLFVILKEDGTISNVKKLCSQYEEVVGDIIPINGGEGYLALAGGYTFLDSNFEFVKYVYCSDKIFSSNFGSLLGFDDGKIFLLGTHRTYYMGEYRGLAVIALNIDDGVKTDIKKTLGEDKTIGKDEIGRPNRAWGVGSSYNYNSGDGRNIIFGGTLNSSRQTATPHPTPIAVATYDRELNVLYGEAYYEDDEHCYYMISLLTTRDGGAVVLATRANYNQALRGYSNPILLKYEKPTSVEDLDIEEASVSLYPNPASDSFMVKTDAFDECDILFYDSMGRAVKVLTSCAVSHDIDVSDLSNGIYVVSLKGKNGIESKRKLVIK